MEETQIEENREKEMAEETKKMGIGMRARRITPQPATDTIPNTKEIPIFRGSEKRNRFTQKGCEVKINFYAN